MRSFVSFCFLFFVYGLNAQIQVFKKTCNPNVKSEINHTYYNVDVEKLRQRIINNKSQTVTLSIPNGSNEWVTTTFKITGALNK